MVVRVERDDLPRRDDLSIDDTGVIDAADGASFTDNDPQHDDGELIADAVPEPDDSAQFDSALFENDLFDPSFVDSFGDNLAASYMDGGRPVDVAHRDEATGASESEYEEPGAAGRAIDDHDDFDSAGGAVGTSASLDDRARGYLYSIRLWCVSHAGASVALGALIGLLIAVGILAVGATVVVSQVDAGIAARSAERLERATNSDSSQLPRIAMRFVSLSDGAFPEVSAHLVLSMPDDSPLPALSGDHLSVTEFDEEGGDAEATLTAFTLDSSSGSCQIVFAANSETVAADRTVRIDLRDSSGYSGGASMAYHALISSEDEAAVTSGEWMLADSDTHRYSISELARFSKDDLFIARNEIFARHGRMFGDSYLQQYFEGKSWYEPRYSAEEFDSMRTPLNEIEIANVNTILSIERG